jgi:hypothetical protein
VTRDDIAYYTRRAETELRRAEESADPAVAMTHRQMAWEYERRVRCDDLTLVAVNA